MRTSLLFLFLTACSSGGSSNQPDAADPGDYLPPGTMLTPFLSDQPVRQFAAAEQVTEAGKDYLAVLYTDAGRLVIDLHEDGAPITVNSFVFLARNHFFDGLSFHRVVDSFVAQGGDPNTLSNDPSTWGTGGPGYSFDVEIDSNVNFNRPGAVGMAHPDGSNVNGSQFFLTLASNRSLDGHFTNFGHVTEGLDVLPRIARGEPPTSPTRMSRVYIVEKAK